MFVFEEEKEVQAQEGRREGQPRRKPPHLELPNNNPHGKVPTLDPGRVSSLGVLALFQLLAKFPPQGGAKKGRFAAILPAYLLHTPMDLNVLTLLLVKKT